MHQLPSGAQHNSVADNPISAANAVTSRFPISAGSSVPDNVSASAAPKASAVDAQPPYNPDTIDHAGPVYESGTRNQDRRPPNSNPNQTPSVAVDPSLSHLTQQITISRTRPSKATLRRMDYLRQQQQQAAQKQDEFMKGLITGNNGNSLPPLNSPYGPVYQVHSKTVPGKIRYVMDGSSLPRANSHAATPTLYGDVHGKRSNPVTTSSSNTTSSDSSVNPSASDEEDYTRSSSSRPASLPGDIPTSHLHSRLYTPSDESSLSTIHSTSPEKTPPSAQHLYYQIPIVADVEAVDDDELTTVSNDIPPSLSDSSLTSIKTGRAHGPIVKSVRDDPTTHGGGASIAIRNDGDSVSSTHGDSTGNSPHGHGIDSTVHSGGIGNTTYGGGASIASTLGGGAPITSTLGGGASINAKHGGGASITSARGDGTVSSPRSNGVRDTAHDGGTVNDRYGGATNTTAGNGRSHRNPTPGGGATNTTIEGGIANNTTYGGIAPHITTQDGGYYNLTRGGGTSINATHSGGVPDSVDVKASTNPYLSHAVDRKGGSGKDRGGNRSHTGTVAPHEDARKSSIGPDPNARSREECPTCTSTHHGGPWAKVKVEPMYLANPDVWSDQELEALQLCVLEQGIDTTRAADGTPWSRPQTRDWERVAQRLTVMFHQVRSAVECYSTWMCARLPEKANANTTIASAGPSPTPAIPQPYHDAHGEPREVPIARPYVPVAKNQPAPINNSTTTPSAVQPHQFGKGREPRLKPHQLEEGMNELLLKAQLECCELIQWLLAFSEDGHKRV